MTHDALGCDGSHVFVGAADAPAAFETQGERNRIGEVAWIGERELVVGHCASLSGGVERIKNNQAGPSARMCNLYSLSK
jgi:hypothetical protein